MKTLIIIGILLAVALLVEGIYQKYRKYARSVVEKNLMGLIINGKFDEFDSYVESKEVKSSIPTFNIEYIKMNAAIMQNNSKKIEESLETLRGMKMKEAQKCEVYLNGFNYYIDKNDAKKASEYKKLFLNVTKDQNKIKYVNYLYDAKINKSNKYLDEMLKDVESGNKVEPTSYLIIAEMYKNIKDIKNENKYRKMYEDELNKIMNQEGENK